VSNHDLLYAFCFICWRLSLISCKLTTYNKVYINMLCLYCSTKCKSFTTINTISRFGDEDVKALHCKALRALVRIPSYTSISMFMVLLLLFYIITNFVFKMLNFFFMCITFSVLLWNATCVANYTGIIFSAPHMLIKIIINHTSARLLTRLLTTIYTLCYVRDIIQRQLYVKYATDIS